MGNAMLDSVINYLRNFFVKSIDEGTFTIDGGVLPVPSALDGQYVKIIGSVLSDGVYRAANGKITGLNDESFEGLIVYMAIPKALLDLVDEMSAWQAKNAPSGLQSESFGGYSYTRASDGNSAFSVFSARLNQWRKF